MSLIGFDDLVEDVAAALEHLDPGADALIVPELAAAMPAAALGVVCAAVLAGGRRRLSVQAFARQIAVSPRTLERDLHDAGAPHPKTILYASMALYAAYHRECRGWSEKRVRAEVGYDRSRQAFSKLVKQYTGKAVGSLSEPGSFDAALNRFLAIFRASHPSLKRSTG